MRVRRYLRRLLASTPLLLIIGLPAVSAASANISRSYQAASNIPNGSLVSLDSAHQGFITLANSDNGAKLLGVALPSQDSLLAIDPGNTTVQVALSGTVTTLVSSVNGAIKVGDQISTSPFAGIGMEALPSSHVVGVAQTAFSDTTPGAETEQVKDKDGKTHQIKIGFIRVSIAVGTGASTSGGGSQANFLQRIIKALTGRTISTTRIVLSIIVTLVALVSLITLVYASIYGSIISVGRNPLAKNAVFRTLSMVMVMAIITVAVACITVYYLLR